MVLYVKMMKKRENEKISNFLSLSLALFFFLNPVLDPGNEMGHDFATILHFPHLRP